MRSLGVCMLDFDATVRRFELALAQPRADGTRPARTDVTIQNYTLALRRLATEAGPLLAEPEVVAAHLQAWRTGVQQRYQRQELSASRIACDVSALRAFYTELNVLGLYTGNPALAVPSMTRTHALPKPMPRSDVTKLFAVPDLTTPAGRRDRAMLELYLHNLRRSEVCLLTTARLAVVLEQGTPTLAVTPFGKGRKERQVPMHPSSAKLVALHLLEQFAGGEWGTWPQAAGEVPDLLAAVDWLLGTVLAGTPKRVFLTDAGRPVGKRWCNKQFRRLCEQAGLNTRWGPHALRHRFGASMIDAGIDIRVIQELMGHADIRTTQIYTHVAGTVKSAATQLLDTPAALEAV